MAKLIRMPPLTSINFRIVTSTLFNHSSSSPLHSPPLFSSLYASPSLRPVDSLRIHRSFSVSAFDTKNNYVSSSSKDDTNDEVGEFEYKEYGLWKSLVVRLRILFAFPWERVEKGSVLTMKLRGEISDQLQSRFSSELSLPQICENFMKATYDPRISGVYFHIEPLHC
ncbi:hypothetical protein BC332_09029 [Capsicum chinense]|nr:hypothetical protein BC332_09029 [Capsicum chinense]